MFCFNSPVPLSEREVDLLTVGEILVDLISDENSGGGASIGYHAYFGGSPSNIAMNARSLGLSVSIASTVGDDHFGDFLVGRLQQAKMDITGLQRVSHPTSMVVLNRSTGTPTPAFYRSADRFLAYTGVLSDSVGRAKIVHFSCWPISREPSRQTIEAVLQEAKRQKVLIGFDPNYHQALWAEEEDGIAYILSLLPQVDVVKPSEDDAERIFGSGTPEEQIARFHLAGARLVILTMGAKGLIASNGKEMVALPSLAKDVVDTTGAGDAFWTGFYTAVVRGYPLNKALELGSAVSAYKLGYCGAVVPLPPLENIIQSYPIPVKEGNNGD